MEAVYKYVVQPVCEPLVLVLLLVREPSVKKSEAINKSFKRKGVHRLTHLWDHKVRLSKPRDPFAGDWSMLP